MNLLQSFILGIVQGLTEFLPISSSGHLVFLQNFFGIRGPELLFDTALHFGTLIALILVFKKDIAELISSFLTLSSPANLKKIKILYRQDHTTRLLILILIGTIPTVVIGLLFKDIFEKLFSSITIVGFMLLLTGGLLWITKYFKNNSKHILQATIYHALIIGFIQGLAITPGISRSGSTIAVALFLGIERETSGRYSFLLSMPAILGATILNFASATVAAGELYNIMIGMAAAIVTGYVSLKFLLKLIKKGRFYFFSPYCVIVGATALLYSFTY